MRYAFFVNKKGTYLQNILKRMNNLAAPKLKLKSQDRLDHQAVNKLKKKT